MAADEQRVAPGVDTLKRLRLALVVAVVLLVAGIVALVLLRPKSTQPASQSAAPPAAVAPAATWAAGAKVAPNFHLTDAYGKPVSLAALRGRHVILTFVDPHCTTFCPRESVVLNDALRAFPQAQRPVVVAVSVDPKTRSLVVLRKEARRFKWLPQWRWAAGSAPKLKAVWHDYGIQVIPTPGDITHSEVAYLIDRNGDQRAVFLWPFKAEAVVAGLKQLS